MGASSSEKSRITKDDIKVGLQRLGIVPGDVAMLHSSLSSLGYVDGGADTVVDAFLEVLGDGGTLVVPSYSESGWMLDRIRSGRVFDHANDSTAAGAIPRAVLARPEQRRSHEPVGTVAAIGRYAQDITRFEPDSVDSCGPLSPFGKMLDLHAKIVLLGVTFNCCTHMHTLESLARVPYSLTKKRYPWKTMLADGTFVSGQEHCHSKGVPRLYTKIEPVLAERGLLKTLKIGSAEVRMIAARTLIDAGLEVLSVDPTFLLTDRGWQPNPDD
jgi:aminoglycoside 3-N-acetyltransferase